jgi:hypothetical protein
MQEAIRLVKEDGYAKKTAAELISGVKINPVPLQTLRDRLDRPDPEEVPILGRPQEWTLFLKTYLPCRTVPTYLPCRTVPTYLPYLKSNVWWYPTGRYRTYLGTYLPTVP